MANPAAADVLALMPSILGKWHIWLSGNGTILLSDEQAKLLYQFDSIDRVINYLSGQWSYKMCRDSRHMSNWLWRSQILLCRDKRHWQERGRQDFREGGACYEKVSSWQSRERAKGYLAEQAWWQMTCKEPNVLVRGPYCVVPYAL